jgi:hypothetical protein
MEVNSQALKVLVTDLQPQDTKVFSSIGLRPQVVKYKASLGTERSVTHKTVSLFMRILLWMKREPFIFYKSHGRDNRTHFRILREN